MTFSLQIFVDALTSRFGREGGDRNGEPSSTLQGDKSDGSPYAEFFELVDMDEAASADWSALGSNLPADVVPPSKEAEAKQKFLELDVEGTQGELNEELLSSTKLHVVSALHLGEVAADNDETPHTPNLKEGGQEFASINVVPLKERTGVSDLGGVGIVQAVEGVTPTVVDVIRTASTLKRSDAKTTDIAPLPMEAGRRPLDGERPTALPVPENDFLLGASQREAEAPRAPDEQLGGNRRKHELQPVVKPVPLDIITPPEPRQMQLHENLNSTAHILATRDGGTLETVLPVSIIRAPPRSFERVQNGLQAIYQRTQVQTEDAEKLMYSAYEQWAVIEADGEVSFEKSLGVLPVAPTLPLAELLPQSLGEVLDLGGKLNLSSQEPIGNGRGLSAESSALPRMPTAGGQLQLVHHAGTQISTAVATGGGREVDIRLDPEELGRVRIVLSSKDGGMNVLIIADRPETLDLMRRNYEQLEASFSDVGYENTSFSFEQGDSDNNDQGRPSDENLDSDSTSELTEVALLGTRPPSDKLDIRL